MYTFNPDEILPQKTVLQKQVFDYIDQLVKFLPEEYLPHELMRKERDYFRNKKDLCTKPFLDKETATFQTVISLYHRLKNEVDNYKIDIDRLKEDLAFTREAIINQHDTSKGLEKEINKLPTRVTYDKELNQLKKQISLLPIQPSNFDRFLNNQNPGWFNSFVRLFIFEDTIKASKQLCANYDLTLITNVQINNQINFLNNDFQEKKALRMDLQHNIEISTQQKERLMEQKKELLKNLKAVRLELKEINHITHLKNAIHFLADIKNINDPRKKLLDEILDTNTHKELDDFQFSMDM